MAGHIGPNASPEQIEEEIAFQNVLLDTLDYGADDYYQRRDAMEATLGELEAMLEQYNSGSENNTGLDGAMDESDTRWWPSRGQNGDPGPSSHVTGGHSSPGSNPTSAYGSSAYLPTTQKRARPSLLSSEDRPSKRATPEPSAASTPSSSGSFEPVERPTTSRDRALDMAERNQKAWLRQAQIERDAQTRLQNEQADADFARRLSQQQQHSYSPAPLDGVQTTIGFDGRFNRPPPPQTRPTEPTMPSIPSYTLPQAYGANTPQRYIKSERGTDCQPSPSHSAYPGQSQPSSQTLVQRPRVSTEVVDLTGDSDEEVQEIAPRSFVPGGPDSLPRPSVQAPPLPLAQPYRQFTGQEFGALVNGQPIPGTHASPQYPMTSQYTSIPQYPPPQYQAATNNGYSTEQPIYGLQLPPPQHSWLQQVNGVAQHAVQAVRSAFPTMSNELSQLNHLITGSSAPIDVSDDDNDHVYDGSRPRQGDTENPYARYGDLYKQRMTAIHDANPAKTKEEIEALLKNIRPDEDIPQQHVIHTPEAMSIKLHKYQELGLTWLETMEKGTNKGGILADDMGLGKTIQMLSHMVQNRSDDPLEKTTLIVAPVALLRQWKKEIETKIKPGSLHRLNVFIHHGASKKHSFAALRDFDVVLTTFGSLAAEVKRKENFRVRQAADPNAREHLSEKCVLITREAKWYRVILDEAQCIKNRKTQAAKGACMLQARYRFCMTGTPMMNSVEELYSLIHFLRIRPYSVWETFNMDFCRPLKSSSEQGRQKAMQMLQALLRTLLLRRTKSSMYEGRPILVLPERSTEIDHPIFSDAEQDFYKALETQTLLKFNKYLEQGRIGSQYSYILVLLLRLRQACCHPHLIKDFGIAAAADMTPESLKNLAKELSSAVVARIKDTNGNFECPVCYDAVPNPAIFLPCGHDTCTECFAKIADPAVGLQQGNENAVKAKCPTCRSDVDPKHITDYNSFKEIHMPELYGEAAVLEDEDENTDSDLDDDSDSETESEEEDDDDADKTLDGFIVYDDEVDDDSETESEAGEDVAVKAETEEYAGIRAESSASVFKMASSGKSKAKAKTKSKRSKKRNGKGKEKARKKVKKSVTLAELKAASKKSAAAKRKYLRRLRRDYISSAKIDKTMERLKEIMEHTDEKTIIFSQWTSLLDLLEVPIDREGWGYRRYDGSMNAKARGDAVEDFGDKKKDVRIMLVSLKAGNAGLNLNMASQVFILDPFWNPYIEEQAIDRAHRIGQERPVQVHRILVEGTVEDRIIQLQEKKRALISEALDEKASQSVARLGVQELAFLFGLPQGAAAGYRPRNNR